MKGVVATNELRKKTALEAFSTSSTRDKKVRAGKSRRAGWKSGD